MESKSESHLGPGAKVLVACTVQEVRRDPDSPEPPYYKLHIEGTGLETFAPAMSVRSDPAPILEDLLKMNGTFVPDRLHERAKAWLEGR